MQHQDHHRLELVRVKYYKALFFTAQFLAERAGAYPEDGGDEDRARLLRVAKLAENAARNRNKQAGSRMSSSANWQKERGDARHCDCKRDTPVHAPMRV